MLEYTPQFRARSSESLGQASRLSCCKASANEVDMSKTSWLTRLWDGLKAFQNRVAIALTVVLLFILYFTVFAVVAMAARLTGQELLHSGKAGKDSFWLPREPVEHSLQAFSRQF
jgi:hypothetical protein